MTDMDELRHEEIQMTLSYVKAKGIWKYLDDPEIAEMIDSNMSVYSNAVAADSFDKVSLCTRGAAPLSCLMCKFK
jgi:hypothetical protein